MRKESYRRYLPRPHRLQLVQTIHSMQARGHCYLLTVSSLIFYIFSHQRVAFLGHNVKLYTKAPPSRVALVGTRVTLLQNKSYIHICHTSASCPRVVNENEASEEIRNDVVMLNFYSALILLKKTFSNSYRRQPSYLKTHIS
jgi:hypothetical protein